MADAEFHIIAFDEARARLEGTPAQVAYQFSEMTEQQRLILLTYMTSVVKKLEAAGLPQPEPETEEDPMGLVKHGQGGNDGHVIPESDQEQKTAAKAWTPEDEEALHEENRDT